MTLYFFVWLCFVLINKFSLLDTFEAADNAIDVGQDDLDFAR